MSPVEAGGVGVDHLTLKELPADSRPRERLLRYGPGALSDTEVVALILRTGTKEETALDLGARVITALGGLPGLARARVGEIMDLRGIGESKAISLKAAIELGARAVSFSAESRAEIRSAQDAARLLIPRLSHLDREQFVTVLLDTKSRVLDVVTVFVGTLDRVLFHPREVFKEALVRSCAGLLLAHNHPSGDPAPSPEDIEITHRAQEAGRVLGVNVVDHVIIGDNRYVSLRQLGFLS